MKMVLMKYDNVYVSFAYTMPRDLQTRATISDLTKAINF